MSRWLDQLSDGTYQVEVYDWEGCRHLYNDVCCNDKCDMSYDFPSPEYDCVKCPYFEPERPEWQERMLHTFMGGDTCGNSRKGD